METNVKMKLRLSKRVASDPIRKRHRVEALWGYVFLLPQFIGLIAFALIPLVSIFALSLVKWDGLGPMHFIGLTNFFNQFADPDFQTALINTVYYTMLVVPAGLLLALLVAMGVNKVRAKTIYRVIYFMPVITGSVAVSVIWIWLLDGNFGLINVLLGQWFHIKGPQWLVDAHLVIPSIAIVSIWWGLGFNMLLFLAGLQGIPGSYLEAAKIDGANKFQLFRHITLPLLSPTLFFVTVISIIHSFEVFDQTYVMTGGGPGKDSYTIVYHLYTLAFQKFEFGSASAAAVVLFAILLALTLLQFTLQRRWVYYEG
ncbi:binding-protein-dependent transport system inner membrane protein [Ktedonobacter sp. SOSP1-52]|nr:sugar ABC transporter permease [Ktedonobacter sp. SOSP1-52]GHO68136.1 binding-protein-dependent transport system inner membrane protein [Ktedonobacter sp. SOSP1-52]